MNAQVELFRRDRHNEQFRHFEILPMDSPGCGYAEQRYYDLLLKGNINPDSTITDPLFPRSILGQICVASVVLPADWFGEQTVITKRIIVKSPQPETIPNTRSALHLGAHSGLVVIDDTYYITRQINTATYQVHRPIKTIDDQNVFRDILRKKYSQHFPWYDDTIGGVR